MQSREDAPDDGQGRSDESASPPKPGVESGSVLVVDDEPTILRLFCMMLEESFPNVRIDSAGNGEEALEKFGRERPGVLVMDLHMPVMDGQRTFLEIERLCEVRHWSMPAVVFCSAFSPPTAIQKRLRRDSRHCLVFKPIVSRELVDAVKARLHTPS